MYSMQYMVDNELWTVTYDDISGKFNNATNSKGSIIDDSSIFSKLINQASNVQASDHVNILGNIRILGSNTLNFSAPTFEDEPITDINGNVVNDNDILKTSSDKQVSKVTVKKNDGSEDYAEYNSITEAIQSGFQLTDLILEFDDGSLSYGSQNLKYYSNNDSLNLQANNGAVDDIEEQTTSPSLESNRGQQMFDPRLQIAPTFVYDSNGTEIVMNINPFQALESMYFDLVGTMEKGALDTLYKQMLKLGKGEDISYEVEENGDNSSTNTKTYSVKAKLKERFGEKNMPSFSKPLQDYMPEGFSADQSKYLPNISATQKVVMGTNDAASSASQIRNEQSVYGVNALMNSYAYTRLIGSLDVVKQSNGTVKLQENRMFDIRDKKRFYDINVSTNDVTSVLTPTTTNIIKLGNADKWGRTPYKFQDFVFCKYWNIIPNNRLITLRKYATPTYDNLNFYGQETTPKEPQEQTFAPIATVLSYFGGESENTLNSLMTFSTGVNWTETEEGKIWDVTGDDGSNPNELIEDTLMGGNDFGRTQGMQAINTILSGTGTLMNKFISFDKFLGFFDQTGYDTNKAQADKLFNVSKVDPYSNGPYENRIIGPVNRINKVYKRAVGIKFEQSLTIKCSYIARPIGNVNTKAALLDILANALIIGSANAVFWGGGYRFQIKPSLSPWGGDFGRKNALEQLYKGKIFGKEGGIAAIFHGFTKTLQDSTGNFSSAGLKSLFAQGAGFVGEIFNQTIGSLLGISSDSLLDSLGLSSSDTEKGKSKADAFTDNVEKLWHNKVIQNTQYPNIQNLHAMLLGEPVGDLHLTVGNPLNPIMVIGNLICDNMQVSFGEELGPDDFPLEMNITYTLKHGMARDRAAIESMFNRGAGKIYDLPDYIKASSDYETKVDAYTGGTGFRNGEFISAYHLQNMAHDTVKDETPVAKGVPPTVGYTIKTSQGSKPSNSGVADNLLNTKFTPVDVYASRTTPQSTNKTSSTRIIPRIVYNGMAIKKVLNS